MRVSVREATLKDDKNIKSLLRENPMDSWVSISLEREPSYFLGASLMGPSQTFIMEEGSEIVGIFSCAFLPLHVNGQKELIGYLNSLRVAKKYRQKLSYIKRGFEALAGKLKDENTLAFFITSIASQNLKAKRLLEANLKGMPTYIPQEKIATLLIATSGAKAKNRLRQARYGDIAQMVAFYNHTNQDIQFSAHLSQSWLEGLDGKIGLKIEDFWLGFDEAGQMDSCFAIWDQRCFRQGVVRGYRQPLGLLRPLYNMFARLKNKPQLPSIGQAYEAVCIAFFTCKDVANAQEVFNEALHVAKNKGAKCAIFGLCPQNSLYPQFVKQFKPHIYFTDIQAVFLKGNPVKMNLKNRLIQPEIALL